MNESTNTKETFTTKRNKYGDYEVMINGVIAYTIMKGGKGWNIMEGDDILCGNMGGADTLKEAKEMINQWRS